MHPHAAYVRGAKRRRTDSHRCGIERHPLRYGGANDATVPLFVNDFIAMVKGRGNHPSIVQIETFNEGDCWSVFKKASEKGAVMLSVWVFPLVSSGSPHVLRANTGVHRTCGEPDEIELAAAHRSYYRIM